MKNRKVEIDRLRRMAKRRGLILSKSPRRDPGADDYGMFRLTSRAGRRLHSRGTISDYALTLEAVRQYLTRPELPLRYQPQVKPEPTPAPRIRIIPTPERKPEVTLVETPPKPIVETVPARKIHVETREVETVPARRIQIVKSD